MANVYIIQEQYMAADCKPQSTLQSLQGRNEKPNLPCKTQTVLDLRWSVNRIRNDDVTNQSTLCHSRQTAGWDIQDHNTVGDSANEIAQASWAQKGDDIGLWDDMYVIFATK